VLAELAERYSRFYTVLRFCGLVYYCVLAFMRLALLLFMVVDVLYNFIISSLSFHLF